MRYKVILSEEASKDIKRLERKDAKALRKLGHLLDEIADHPRTGTGQCERLKHYEEETWLRRITREHRLVYKIYDDTVIVLVVTAFGHYG